MLQGFFTISDARRLRSKLLLEATRARRREEERGGGMDGGVCRAQRNSRLQETRDGPETFTLNLQLELSPSICLTTFKCGGGAASF